MEIDLEQIRAAALASVAHGENIGESSWYDVSEYTGNMLMAQPDAEFSAIASSAVVLTLIERLERAEADARRLDSGVIMTSERDDFSEEYKRERRGLDLRAMIDEAVEAAKRDAQREAG